MCLMVLQNAANSYKDALELIDDITEVEIKDGAKNKK